MSYFFFFSASFLCFHFSVLLLEYCWKHSYRQVTDKTTLLKPTSGSSQHFFLLSQTSGFTCFCHILSQFLRVNTIFTIRRYVIRTHIFLDCLFLAVGWRILLTSMQEGCSSRIVDYSALVNSPNELLLSSFFHVFPKGILFSKKTKRKYYFNKPPGFVEYNKMRTTQYMTSSKAPGPVEQTLME